MNSLTEIKDYLAQLEKKEAGVTAGPWTHRKHPELGSFVEAKVEGKPYGQEIFGEDYFEELNREKDCDFVADSRTEFPRLRQMCQRAIDALEKIAKPALGGKQQQSDAQQALQSIAGIIQKEGK